MNNIKKMINYCLNCPLKPCQKRCPLENDIPSVIKLAKEGNFLKAFRVLNETTVLASICGRICPSLKYCEGNCIRRLEGESVKIHNIEAYIGDKFLKKKYALFSDVKDFNGKKVAIVGSGPSGLSCAAYLRRLGYAVTIFEKHDYLGGLIIHGIPEFRLDRKICDLTFKKIIDLGIEVNYGFELGRNLFLRNLRKEYDAVFLGIGANVSKFPNIKGKNLENVYGVNNFLESFKKLDFYGKSVVIVGGGNTALDMAFIARKNGANVLVVYRKNKMKAFKDDVSLAFNEKIDFIFNTEVKQIISNDNNYKVYLINKDGYKFIYLADYVFFAIGSIPDNKLVKKLGLKLDINDYIKTDKNQMTSLEGVFAGGDIINEEKSVAKASFSGKCAAYNIDLYLKKIDFKKKSL